jgi:hypothetical protein
MRFSERQGINPVRSLIQREQIDDALRSGLWNVIDMFALSPWSDLNYVRANPELETFLYSVWHSYFKKPIDSIPERWPRARGVLRDYFFHSHWWQVYDLVEFIANNHPHDDAKSKLRKAANVVMARELGAYRFVGARIAEITAEEEIAEIEAALSSTASPLAGVRTHLRSALDLLSDRQKPDYRNSIKESISAVEAVCNALNGGKATTLSPALTKLGGSVPMHPALEGAFKKLYGYTSDAQGIRHALMDEPSLDFEDAKFMLVSCSAFVNYLVAKAARAGLSLSGPAS